MCFVKLLQLRFFWCFFHDWIGIMGLGEEHHRGELSSLHQIRGTWYQSDTAPLILTSTTWLRSCPPSIAKLLFFSFFILFFAKESISLLHTQGKSIYTYHLNNFVRNIFPSPPFTYLIIYLFQLGQIYFTSGYYPILQYLLCCSNCPSFGHRELFLVISCVLLTDAHIYILLAFPCFFGTRCYKMTLCYPWTNPRINHFPVSPVSF